MPARARKQPPAAPPEQQLSLKGVGKVACTRSFHCVKAHDRAAFYKLLIQLN